MDHSYKLIGIFLLIININTISALGVNSPYWNENPLKMYSGQIIEVTFPLVNSVNEKTTEASVSLVEGKEIAEITSGEKYTVQPGSADKNIILKISIPADSKIGDSYKVKFSVKYTPEGGEGNVKLDVGYNIEFPIEIVDQANASSLITLNTGNVGNETQEQNYTIIIIIVAILLILLLAIIILMIKKYKQNKSN
ncbi:MAG: hypothetical protein WC584_03675 [Candidatus Pacearchaeota archaeon]